MASQPRIENDLEADLHTEHQVLNMGPSHPATHGTVKFVDRARRRDGRRPRRAGRLPAPRLREGVRERLLVPVLPYTDRLNYNSAILANLGFCMAVEKLLGLETPERCQWLRVMASELSRVGDHLTRCGASCLALAAMK